MSSINKYLIYSLSLLLILLLNVWFLNTLKQDIKETYKPQHILEPKVKEEVQYMTVRFNDDQQLDKPLINKSYIRNGRTITATSETVTPRVILSLFGKNEWDVIHVSKDGTFLLKLKKSIELPAADAPPTIDESLKNPDSLEPDTLKSVPDK